MNSFIHLTSLLPSTSKSDLSLTWPLILGKSWLKSCEQTRAFYGLFLREALTFLEVFLDRYGKQDHGSAPQFGQQAVDVDAPAFRPSPLGLTVWAHREHAGWETAQTVLLICLWGNYSVFQPLQNRRAEARSLDVFSLHMCSSLHQKQRKPQEMAACISRKLNYITSCPSSAAQNTPV